MQVKWSKFTLLDTLFKICLLRYIISLPFASLRLELCRSVDIFFITSCHENILFNIQNILMVLLIYCTCIIPTEANYSWEIFQNHQKNPFLNNTSVRYNPYFCPPQNQKLLQETTFLHVFQEQERKLTEMFINKWKNAYWRFSLDMILLFIYISFC